MKKLIQSNVFKTGLLLSALILALFPSGCGNNNYAEYDINGTWYIYQTTTGSNAGVLPQTVVISMSTGTNVLSGMTWSTTSSYTFSSGNEDGSGNISFTWSTSTDTYNFSGTMNGPSVMSGTWSSSNNGSGFWNAICQQAPAKIGTGIWNATTTGTGAYGSPITLTQSSDTIAVSGGSSDTGTGNIDAVSGADNVIFYLKNGSGTYYVFTGTLNTSSNYPMSGTWENSSNESGSWSATQ